LSESSAEFDGFRAELAEVLLLVRADRPGCGVVIESVTGLRGVDLDSLEFVVHFRNERDGSLHADRWSRLGEIWRDFESPGEVAAFVINDLHERLFAID